MTAPLYGLGAGQTNDRMERGDYVAASGGLLFTWSLGSAVGPSLAGVLMGRAGPAGLFVYLATVLGSLGVFTVARMLLRSEVPAEQRGGYVPATASPPRHSELVSRVAAALRQTGLRQPALDELPTARTEMRYSAFSLLRQGLSGHEGWPQAWRSPALKPSYDAVVIGGGGHGLAAAYYLAKSPRHPPRRRAGARLARRRQHRAQHHRSSAPTTSSPKAWRCSISRCASTSSCREELNYNIMLSQRGMLNMAHSDHQMELMARNVNAMLINGIDVELLDAQQVRAELPFANFSAGARFPILGGFVQRRAGIARHDAVAWGYARAADALGVDIVQNCEVPVSSSRRPRRRAANIVRRCLRRRVRPGGLGPQRRARAKGRLPAADHQLRPAGDGQRADQAGAGHRRGVVGDRACYVSQSDKGELVFGAGVGPVSVVRAARQPEHHAGRRRRHAGDLSGFRGLKMLRQWAGIVDVPWDYSPILGPAPVGNLFLNTGWGTGGFKATPAGGYFLAHAMATGAHHPISAPFDISRFSTGALIDEAAGAGISH